VIPHRNDGWLRYYSLGYLRGQQTLQGLHIAPTGATTPLTFRTLAGKTFTLDVAAGAMTSASALPANRMLYFRYNSCTDTPGNPFAEFAANLLATLDSNPVDTVVLDLRRNVGGDSSVWNPLLTGLAERMPGA
jgi:C-terminal processing protease CtpA/Prc